CVHHRDLRTSPTRRSSDLQDQRAALQTRLDPRVRPFTAPQRRLKAAFGQTARAMLILPLHRPLTAANFPVMTALLIALNVFVFRSEEHTSELQSRENIVCR